MDPFSAILLIGLMTVATVKTAGTAATDGIAQARGQTPPSQERWRAKEERRRQRGEQPRQDPGGLRRIWQQHTEAAAEKSAAKHRGKLEYLRDHGDEIAEGKKRQLERAARRREYLGGKMAQAGGSSWDALKTAAQKAAEAKRTHGERKLEDEAWRENERRGDVDVADAEPTDAGGEDAAVLSFTRRPRGDGSTEVEVNPGGDGDSTITGDPADPLTWQGTDSRGRDIQTGRGPSRMETAPDGSEGVVHDTDTYRLRTDETPERRIVLDAQRQRDAEATGSGEEESAAQKDGEDALTDQKTDPEKDYLLDPDKRSMDRISVADLHRRRAREDEDRRRADEKAQRAHEAEQAQAEREHRERLSQIQQPSTNTTDNSGGTEMSTPNSSSVEITDLETAQLRSDESAQYAATVQSVLDTQIAGIQKAIAGMEAEAAQQEQGSTSLTGEGFDTGITGRFDRGQESFTNAVAALRQLDQALNTAKDEVNLAQNEMKSASSFFSQQRSISESLSAAGQGGGISSRTGFYTGA
ncbi:hypothetical protein GCM10027174_44910 [Salinifilum aidingensis]